jgi:hypothetical protein
VKYNLGGGKCSVSSVVNHPEKVKDAIVENAIWLEKETPPNNDI